MKENRPLNYNLRQRSPSFVNTSKASETGQESTNTESTVAESQHQQTATSNNTAGILQETGAHHSTVETVDQPESDEQLPITSSTQPSEGSLDHHQNITTEPSEESQNPHQSVEQSNNSIVADISEENLTLLQPNIMTTVQPNKFNGSESPCIWLSKLTAWQKFNNLTDKAVLDYIPCLLEGSAGTWFQTLNPTQYQTLQAFKDLLSERYKPASYKMAMLGIRQESGETCEKYLERAERLALAHHDLDESYKVQFIANGLISNIRGRVLAREPQTFQALRRDISLVQLELGCEQQVSFVAHNPTFDLSELTKSINTHIEQTVTAQINALAERFHESPNYYYREERAADDHTHRCYDRHRDPPRCDRYRENSRERTDTPYRDQSRERSSYRDSSRGREPSPHYSSRDRSRQHRTQDSSGSRHWSRRDQTPRRHHDEKRECVGGSQKCRGCGGKSCPDRKKCPAFNTRCSNCTKFHHFRSVCTIPKAQTNHHHRKTPSSRQNTNTKR